MQISELVRLGRYLSDALQGGNLRELYQQLINAINQAAQNQEPNKVQSVLNEIVSVHKNAEAALLSPAQKKLLLDYGADKLIGAVALERINRILAKHQAHPQGLANAFKKLMNETGDLTNRAAQLISVVEPLIATIEEPSAQVKTEEGRLWLYFAEDVAVASIGDLERAAETWKQILHNFSRLPGAGAEEGRILSIQKSSPLELELAANMALLTPLALGITWVLSRIEHVIKIRQQVEVLKQLKVKTKIIEDVKAEAEHERKRIAAETADKIKEQFDADNESRNAVQQALSKIIRFIEGGGQLDIDAGTPESDEEEEDDGAEGDGRSINALIASIRREMKALPSPPPGVNNDDQASEEAR